MEYTQQYEYAKKMISSFIVGEAKLLKDMNQDLDSSMMNNLFTFNMCTLSLQGTMDKLEKSLGNQDSLFLVRLRAMATEVATALGDEFVEQLIKNVKYGLHQTCVITNDYIIVRSKLKIGRNPSEIIDVSSRKADAFGYENIENIFLRWPWFWIIVISEQVYRISISGK